MTSFASIDRIEGPFAICEVELIEMYDSTAENYMDKETKIMDVPCEFIRDSIFTEPQEGDVLVVEHNCKEVLEVYYKDNVEKAKRIEILQSLYDS